MLASLHGQLRCCLAVVLALLVLQFAVVAVLLHYSLFDELLTSRLLFQQRQLSLSTQPEWREFIAHTPEQPNAFFQYNRQLSDKTDAVRVLPMTRHESCNTRSYLLPHYSRSKLSIVISFYNEARSMLLRTILTLIERTPVNYLHELIIIDDCSEDVGLLDSLKRLMGSVYGARGNLTFIFKRNPHRKGLIWSRNEGARVASGYYLLFLDSHSEVNDGWLEPLLERLARNSSLAVSPLLDPIEPESLSYRAGNVLLKGGFDWSLHFHWLPRVLAEQEPPEREFSSPAFAGGILMISREWFSKLHGFHPQLQIWGGESIELAIKLWLCGGQIEIVPCSRIGHIFRQRHAFEFPPLFGQQLDTAQATYLRNSKIIAESWLDEYKYLFYALKPAAKQIPLNLHTDPTQLKTGLQCRRFDWYMRHVNPELKLQLGNFSALGTLRNEGRCLHVDSTLPKLQLLLTSCYRLQVTQWHLHHETGQLSSFTEVKRCLGVWPSERPQLTLEPCLRADAGLAPSQRWQCWQRRGTQLLHAETHLCLDNPLKDQLEMSRCRPQAASQSFQFALEILWRSGIKTSRASCRILHTRQHTMELQQQQQQQEQEQELLTDKRQQRRAAYCAACLEVYSISQLTEQCAAAAIVVGNGAGVTATLPRGSQT